MAEPLQLVILRVGPGEYGMDIMRVQEIIPPQAVCPLPEAPAYLEGVIFLRDQVILAVDLRRRMRLPEPFGPARMVVAMVGEHTMAFLVDGVTQVARVDKEAIRPAPAIPGLEESPFLGTIEVGGRTVILLDIKAIISDKDSPALDQALDQARELIWEAET